MDSAVTAAVIGGLSTISASVLTLLVQGYLRSKKHVLPPNDRLAAIEGTWSGLTQQDRGPEGQPIAVELEAKLAVRRRSISGTAKVKWAKILLDVNLTGAFVTDSIIKLEYASTVSGVMNFGVLFLALSANGQTLKGMMLGYGSESERIVFGTTEVTKRA